MPGYTLSVDPAATEEAAQARAWYAERSPSAATSFVAEVDGAIASILEAPERWPAYLHGTRRLLLRRFPFSVVYRVVGAEVQIVAFAHGRRRPAYWQQR